MGLIFSSDNDECTNHHFGEYMKKPEFRIREKRLSGMKQKKVVSQRHIKRCQHENCFEKRELWENIAILDADRFEKAVKKEHEMELDGVWHTDL